MEREDLADDPRFLDNPARNRHESELREIISSWTKDRSQDDVLRRLREDAVPCAPVWTLGDLVESGHPQTRGMILPGISSRVGNITHVPQPVHFRGTKTPAGARSPQLGEDTEEVLRTVLGYDEGRIASLREGRVL